MNVTYRDHAQYGVVQSYPQQQQQQQQEQILSQEQQYHPVQQQQQQQQQQPSVVDARKQWRQHGDGLTQSLEDRRTMLTMAARGSAKDKYYMKSSDLAYGVRVVGAGDRIDPGGSVFTAYLVEVEAVGMSRQVLEHRYSEFLKLHSDLQNNGIAVRASFPSKISWAGRIGTFTPAAHFGKDKRHELVTYRKIKLDIWLVEVAEKLVRGEIQNSELQKRVVEFFQKSDAYCPPCDRVNTVDWRSLQDDQRPENALNKPNPIIERHIGNPLSSTLGSEIRKAAYTVLNMCGKGMLSSDRSIPLDLLHQARGLCFLTVVKGGLIFSGKIGTGVVIARQPDGGWSPPSAIGTVGVGWGAQIGADLTSFMIILNNDEAVKAFAGKGSINLGAELKVAVGPFGRGATGNVNAGDGGFAPAYAYGHSKGFFAGISLEGSILKCRNDINSNFYGRPVEPTELLFSLNIPRPRAAQPLYDALNEALELPIVGFRPSELRQNKGTGYYHNPANNGGMDAPKYNIMDGKDSVFPPAAGVLIDGVPSLFPSEMG